MDTRAIKADVTDKADAFALSYGPSPVRFPSDAFRTVRYAQTVDPRRPSRYVALGSPVGGSGRQKQHSLGSRAITASVRETRASAECG